MRYIYFIFLVPLLIMSYLIGLGFIALYLIHEILIFIDWFLIKSLGINRQTSNLELTKKIIRRSL